MILSILNVYMAWEPSRLIVAKPRLYLKCFKPWYRVDGGQRVRFAPRLRRNFRRIIAVAQHTAFVGDATQYSTYLKGEDINAECL